MFKIYLDPGHAGDFYNKSTTGLNYYESAAMWTFTGYLKLELEARGAVVGLSRTSKNSDPSLYTRGYGSKGYDLFLSLHSNACGTESVDYPLIIRGYDKTQCEDFAQKMAKLVSDTIGTKQAGRVITKTGSSGGEYYGVLRGARAAGLTHYYIIEHSFHTNRAATQWLMSDANLRKLAKAEAELIMSYFGVSNNSGTTTTTTTTTAKATLCKGSKGAAVKELQTNLNTLGYNCGNVDGDFGDKTDTALRNFQRDYKLTVDGRFGPASQKAMATALTNKKNTASSGNMNYGLVFDAEYYANKYADLKATFGTNTTALLNHFKNYGMKEGRKAISTFDVKMYKTYNADLQKAFGNDYKKYFEHYMTYGYKENRRVV